MKATKLHADFEKDLKKLLKNGFDFTELDAILEKLRNEERLESKYRDHQLKGNLKAFREFHLKGDLLVLYKSSDTELEFYAIDNHNNLFKRFGK